MSLKKNHSFSKGHIHRSINCLVHQSEQHKKFVWNITISTPDVYHGCQVSMHMIKPFDRDRATSVWFLYTPHQTHTTTTSLNFLSGCYNKRSRSQQSKFCFQCRYYYLLECSWSKFKKKKVLQNPCNSVYKPGRLSNIC